MATMDDQAKQAFTAASDWSKQIMTLSTAILTLTVAFSDSVFGDLSNSGMWLLVIAWLLYVVSILGGFLVLIASNEALVDHTPVVPPTSTGLGSGRTCRRSHLSAERSSSCSSAS